MLYLFHLRYSSKDLNQHIMFYYSLQHSLIFTVHNFTEESNLKV